MRVVFAALLFKAKVTLPTPLQIVAFRNTKEMRQFAPLYKGKPTQVSGLFEGNTDRSFILLDMSVEDPWQVVFHEYAHQLLNGNTNASVQLWFDEGFAEFFSTIKVSGKDAEVGTPPETDFLILRQSQLAKVSDLFRGATKLQHLQRKRRSPFPVLCRIVVGCALPLRYEIAREGGALFRSCN
jgi:hypothetical protein